ncbi:MAG: beta-ketoacyl-ACP synthase III [Negativicutes bacterium]|jgi:3-oxoacyl-[acyl-carrier-protein] synthase-3
MEICSAGIIGLGMYVPEKVVTNADIEKIVDTSDAWITEVTGIKQRHVVEADVTTSDLAVRAAEAALKDANVAVEDINLIIVATASPDMFFPSVACLVQNRIGAKNAAAFDLAAGCSGFVYALITASQFVQNGTYKNILVIGAETLTKITDWTDRNTCVLFGDGAGAAVVSKVADGYGLLGFDLGADGSGGELLKVEAGGTRMPATAETVAAHKHFIQMNGNEVYKFAVKIMGATAIKAVEKSGITVDDVSLLIPHQANIRIIQAAAKRLKLPMDRVVVNIQNYGNTSSASIPMALCEAKIAGKLIDDEHSVLVGFGAGLTWASCVLRWGGIVK